MILCCICTHFLTYVIVTFWEIQRKFRFLKVRVEYAYGQLYTYIKGSSAEIQTPAQWNLIGCGINTPCLGNFPAVFVCQLHLIVL
jgi:hypothetical protein